MIINDVHRGIRKNKNRRRIGRGIGSGHGKLAGRGHKGQGSRAGFSMHPTFQGGAMPLVRRIPKRGFNNRWALRVAVVNLGQIDKAFEVGEEVTLDGLTIRNLAKGNFDVLKVLGDGELTKKLNITAHRFSETAVRKIEKAGGKTIVLPGKTPVEVKKRQQRAEKRAGKV